MKYRIEFDLLRAGITARIPIVDADSIEEAIQTAYSALKQSVEYTPDMLDCCGVAVVILPSVKVIRPAMYDKIISRLDLVGHWITYKGAIYNRFCDGNIEFISAEDLQAGASPSDRKAWRPIVKAGG